MIALLASLALAAPPIDGTFQPSIPQAEIDARLTTAITDASMQFNWAIRGIARGRIEDQASACSTLKFFNNATHTGVKCDAQDPIVRLNDNSQAPFDSDGRQVTSTVRVRDGAVDIDWTTDSGVRKTTYTFHGEDAFDLTVAVSSTQMTTPMTFTIPYRRTGPTSGLQ